MCILLIKFRAQSFWSSGIRLISKRRSRQMMANSLGIFALKVIQWWAQTPLVIAEVNLKFLISIWWSRASFSAVNVASSKIFFFSWRLLKKLIQRVLWSKLHSFLTVSYDIKNSQRSSPESISNCLSHVTYTHWTNGKFQRISSLQSRRMFSLLICIIHSDCLGFFVEVRGSI